MAFYSISPCQYSKRFTAPFRKFAFAISLLGSVILVTGCSTLQPQAFADIRPHFALDRYFTGHALSWGVFENRSGNPRLYFVCNSYGKRDKAHDVVLTQFFKFSDGKAQQRIWHIHRVDETHWKATANDMIGTAEGEGDGNAFYWEYTLTLDRKDPLDTIHVRQWMYQPEGTDTLMTRLVITKLGITVSEVSESIHHVVSR